MNNCTEKDLKMYNVGCKYNIRSKYKLIGKTTKIEFSKFSTVALSFLLTLKQNNDYCNIFYTCT